ncbi:hypothetical protein [Granulosicoccus antarcticus]|uniref:Flp/Fap pilin component n=1 Tax=Granulosicoccus antarcticus IMCC3135 TaxID=1192854 RepID=A0A2Z2NT67_9GAMM|nr:hypothetical protein [Granulosicoccus antarcticus]ASJ71940.1 hypothetical protein IMCC3135_09215 [Granulosicoccus antarcticus IMCC3135]
MRNATTEMKQENRSTCAQARRVTGQGMTEYIIIVALIAIASIAAVSFFGSAVQAQFAQLGAELTGGTVTDAATAAGTAPTPKAAGLGDYGQ